jgi:restriction system protein
MATDNPLLKMTPERFEKYVRGIVKREKMTLQDFEVTHLESVNGMDGEYTMDVVATFVLFGGAIFRTLIECKRYSNPIEREIVMILEQKLQSTGSQKGMIFSTSSFQSGAIEFAKAHGIALVFVQWGRKRVFVTNERRQGEIPSMTEEDRILESWTAELITQKWQAPFPYLARPDVFPGENLKAYLGLSADGEGES